MSWTAERARVASLSRSRTPDDPELVAARRAMLEYRAAAYLDRLLATSPALTDEQRERLARQIGPEVVEA